MRVDLYNSKKRYLLWKARGGIIEDINKPNADLLRKFIFDLENGTNINTASKKGARSYIRLNSYRSKLKLFFIESEKLNQKNILELRKDQFNLICNNLRNGILKRRDGKLYIDASDYIKSFKAFWHWLMLTQEVGDITIEADTSKKKPRWVYLEEKQFKRLAENCKPFYKAILWLGYDTGLRATELLNARVNWFSDNYQFISVPDEVSKTFGRNFKVMLSNNLIKEYIEDNKLKNDDLLFNISHSQVNKYLMRKSKSLFGDGKSKAGEKYSKFSLGDVRHNSACYWLPRYPTQQGMMYRFGWKRADKIFYYSEFLGMVDVIKEDDLLIDVTKTDLQRKNEELSKKLELVQEGSNKEIESIKRELEDFKKSFASQVAEKLGFSFEGFNNGEFGLDTREAKKKGNIQELAFSVKKKV